MRKGYSKKPNGSWKVRLANPNGGYYMETIPAGVSEVEVKRIVAGIRTDLERKAHGLPTHPKEPEMSFGSWCPIYLANQRSRLASRSITTLRLSLARCLDVIGDVALSEITSEELAALADTLTQSMTTRTTRSYLSRVRACLVTAKEAGYLESVPEVPTLRPSRKPLPRPAQVIPPEHRALLLEEASPSWLRLYLRLLDVTGARPEEIRLLESEDLDGSGWLTLGRHEGARKTGERRFPLPPDLAEELRDQEEGRLFGGDKSNVRYRWRRLLKRLELPSYRLKDFRTTRATLAMRAGIDPKTAAVLLGHSPEMLLRVYRQVQDEDLRDATAKMSAKEGLPGKVLPLAKRTPNEPGRKRR